MILHLIKTQTRKQPPKKVKRYRNLARKKSYQRLPKKTDDDVFLKEVPVQPRDRWLEKQKIMLNL